MSFDAQRLYELLPAIYRIRDAKQGGPLKALLSVIAEQVMVLEEDLDQLYDNQFIETCAEWVVPYIGDLIGYRSLHGVAPRVSSPRSEVANTIGYRRRKGTAAMLEQLARDVTGWNARVVEFFQLLATTQYMNHIRPNNWYAPDLRQWEPLEQLHTPFERIAHTADVRSIAMLRGKYNIPNIGIFLWRLRSYPLTESPAFQLDERRYLFSPLGNDMPLFTLPQTEDEIPHLAEPINVPMPISRRMLYHYLNTYYGKGKSIFLRIDGVEIDAAQVEAYDLSDAGGGAWAHQPQDKFAIDPVLGRIACPQPQNQAPPTDVKVTFHYGFSADMGGGEYERSASFDLFDGDEPAPIRVPQDHQTIQQALDALPAAGGVVEITDSGRYEETLSISAQAGGSIVLRAANKKRSTLVLSSPINVTGADGTTVSMNGLLICAGPGFTGDSLLYTNGGLSGSLKRLRIRHCTLVPGLNITANGDPLHGDKPGLIVELDNVNVEIDHSIIGGLRIVEDATVEIMDSIVDATSETGVAYAQPDGEAAGGTLRMVKNCTIIGKVHTAFMEMASNTIFLADLGAAGDSRTAPVRSARKQKGCVRFSYLPLFSVVPRRYHCQPQSKSEEALIRPQFTSLRYGDPGYGQLTQRCAAEIRMGADDEAEMGAFHTLYQPQREINLRVRLDEYLRFGLEAGIFYAT